MNKANAVVVEHYRDLTKYYNFFWNRGKTHALHFGFYDNEHRTWDAAQLNTNRVLAEMANIGPDDTVLDAGCGIGGSALWLAKERGAYVVGVSISPLQISIAKKLTKENKMENKTEFLVADYTDTRLVESNFSVVWALESVCHALDKKVFLKEAFRVLKPKGRIVISDGYLTKPVSELNTENQKLLREFEEGFGSLKMVTLNEFMLAMKDIGFIDIEWQDKTQEILPDVLRVYYIARIVHPFVYLLSKFGLVSKYLPAILKTGYLHKVGVDRKLGCYGIITARKPA
ncbi:MAG: methyltransferase domain-containing protein [bacterium]|nr:methyltransferase domain-containing protein [bacterium]